MSKKNIMRAFKMDEISSVDNPAQKYARMVIMKRDETADPASIEDKKVDKSMTIEKTVESVTAEFTKSLEDVNAKLAKAEVIAKMNDAEKAHYGKMDDAGKDAWLKKSEADRAKEISDLAKNDETLVVEGATISKREVGEASFAMFKRLKAAEDRIAKAEAKAALAEFTKRAAEEFGNLPGTDLEKAEILSAISGLDAKIIEKVETILKAANDVNAAAFKKNGVAKGDAANSVEAKIEKRAKEIEQSDKITYAQAYVKAMAENPADYAELTQ